MPKAKKIKNEENIEEIEEVSTEEVEETGTDEVEEETEEEITEETATPEVSQVVKINTKCDWCGKEGEVREAILCSDTCKEAFLNTYKDTGVIVSE